MKIGAEDPFGFFIRYAVVAPKDIQNAMMPSKRTMNFDGT